MPVIQQEDYISTDTTAMEILQRRSINSLLGLQNSRVNNMIPSSLDNNTDASTSSSSEMYCFDQQSNYIGNAQKNYRIPVGRVPMMDEFPSSPEEGQIPTYHSQYFNHIDRNEISFDKHSNSEYGSDVGLIRHPDSPDSNALSSSSTCSNVDGSITEMMNGLNINLPTVFKQNQRSNNNGSYNKLIHNEDMNEATCTWHGTLPYRMRFPNSSFSPKIFLGGLPWDVDEKTLIQTFKRFGHIKLDWPGKENNTPQPKGFVYVIFPSEVQVHYLLSVSTCDNTGNWYFTISTKKMRAKQVQIIPWDTRDSSYVRSRFSRLDPLKTVFVGALHGMLTAEGLAKIMDDLFGGVMFAGIDTDKYKYPIGSGRVTFDNSYSFMRAVNSAFINIKTEKFQKKIQVDPYLEDTICSVCNVQQGPYFCKTYTCFRYFCRSCWQLKHSKECHKPLTRTKSLAQSSNYAQKLKNQQHLLSTTNFANVPLYNTNVNDPFYPNHSLNSLKCNTYNTFNMN